MISLVVVNYRSSGLALQAIRSARMSTRDSLQVVGVDNSCDHGEAEALRPHVDVLIVSPGNVGYAAAINRGRQECRGEIMIVSNPDVVFAPGAIDSLVAALADRDAAVAGPALFWDDGYRWMLPPSDLQTVPRKLSDVLSTRSSAWRRRRDRRRFRERVRFWSLRDTTPVQALSGAVMAIRVADFDAVGGFDESFPLYFEETDFLRRIAKREGRGIVYVPAARCRHLYNQSAAANSAHAAEAYARSEMHYLEKWSSRPVARLLKRMERPPFLPQTQRLDGPLDLPAGDVVVEASPLADFATAAGHFPVGPQVEVPPEVWASYRGAVLYLRIVDRNTARLLATYARYRSD